MPQEAVGSPLSAEAAVIGSANARMLLIREISAARERPIERRNKIAAAAALPHISDLTIQTSQIGRVSTGRGKLARYPDAHHFSSYFSCLRENFLRSLSECSHLIAIFS